MTNRVLARQGNWSDPAGSQFRKNLCLRLLASQPLKSSCSSLGRKRHTSVWSWTKIDGTFSVSKLRKLKKLFQFREKAGQWGFSVFLRNISVFNAIWLDWLTRRYTARAPHFPLSTRKAFFFLVYLPRLVLVFCWLGIPEKNQKVNEPEPFFGEKSFGLFFSLGEHSFRESCTPLSHFTTY